MQGLSQCWLHYFQGCPAPRSLPTLSTLPVSRFQLSFELVGLEQIISLSEGLPNCTPLYAYCSGRGCFSQVPSIIKASTSTGIQSTASKVPNVPGRAPRCFELVTILGSHSFLFHIPFPLSGPAIWSVPRIALGMPEDPEKAWTRCSHINFDSAYPICLGASKSSRTASVTISSGCDATHP